MFLVGRGEIKGARIAILGFDTSMYENLIAEKRTARNE